MMTNTCSKFIYFQLILDINLDDLTSLPYLNITSTSTRSAPSLTQSDGDVFVPSCNQDFKYYTPEAKKSYFNFTIRFHNRR